MPRYSAALHPKELRALSTSADRRRHRRDRTGAGSSGANAIPWLNAPFELWLNSARPVRATLELGVVNEGPPVSLAVSRGSEPLAALRSPNDRGWCVPIVLPRGVTRSPSGPVTPHCPRSPDALSRRTRFRRRRSLGLDGARVRVVQLPNATLGQPRVRGRVVSNRDLRRAGLPLMVLHPCSLWAPTRPHLRHYGRDEPRARTNARRTPAPPPTRTRDETGGAHELVRVSIPAGRGAQAGLRARPMAESAKVVNPQTAASSQYQWPIYGSRRSGRPLPNLGHSTLHAATVTGQFVVRPFHLGDSPNCRFSFVADSTTKLRLHARVLRRARGRSAGRLRRRASYPNERSASTNGAAWPVWWARWFRLARTLAGWISAVARADLSAIAGSTSASTRGASKRVRQSTWPALQEHLLLPTSLGPTSRPGSTWSPRSRCSSTFRSPWSSYASCVASQARGPVLCDDRQCQPFSGPPRALAYVVPEIHVSYFEPTTLDTAFRTSASSPSTWIRSRLRGHHSLQAPQEPEAQAHLKARGSDSWNLVSRLVDHRFRLTAQPRGTEECLGLRERLER